MFKLLKKCIIILTIFIGRFINLTTNFKISPPIDSFDEPRIGNYPETIITSADEMFKAMEEGLVGWKGHHCDFYWDESRDKKIRKNIIEFFKAHPDGIITFG